MAAPDVRVSPATQGLTTAEVRERIAAGMVNAVPASSGRTVAQILRANLLTRFNAILGALLVVVAVVGPLQDGLFGVVLTVNAGIGIVQELRAKRTLDRLAVLTAPRARLVRDGVVAEHAVGDLVVDDVVEVRAGDQVVADGVVLEATGLEIDESLLTGEAEPSPRVPGDRVMSGSFVVAGSGRFRATGIGTDSYAQRLQAEARRFSLVHSELQQGTNRILRVVTWVMVPAAALLVTSQMLRSGLGAPDALRGSVAGVAAMVPEGLVLLTTLAFGMGAVRLARRRVLVQELAAIEGLARVDVLCIDKTGTLTEGAMALHAVVPVAGASHAAEVHEALAALAGSDRAANPTAEALRQAFGPPPSWDAVRQVPFASSRKWSGASFRGGRTWVVGAPDVLLDAGVGAGVTSEALAAAVAQHSAAGRRVLLVASSGTRLDGDALPHDAVPEALVVLEERVRPDAPATIRFLLEQGVAVTVLSGDDPRTVAAVAQRVGIPVIGRPVDARRLQEDPEDLALALATANVFGRVQPEQKRAMVRALQARGHVVAMTGDGINDVPALKAADLGIAMGTGSQASRSVGRLVLLDGRFAAVPTIVAEGRRVIANIERVANLFVTKTVYAAVLAVAVGVVAVPYPFYPRHLTVVSSLTIGIPGFFLALASGAPRAHTGFVVRVARFTVPAGLTAAAATYGAYAIARAAPATTPTQARAAAATALFVVGLAVLARLARPLDGWRVALVAAMAGAGVAAALVPLSREIFSLTVPPLPVLLAVLAAAALAVGPLWWLLRVVSRVAA